MNKELLIKLENLVIDSSICSIKREKIDTYYMHGFILKCNDCCILLEYEDNFQMDGYKIIRTKDVTEVRYGEREAFVENILCNEGIIRGTKQPQLTNLENLKDILLQFADNKENIIIECETNENNNFLIGKVIMCGKNTFSFLNFDMLGYWDKKPTTVFYSKVTCITIGGRYLEIISKYIKPMQTNNIIHSRP
jgi:hypothetical protein